MLIKELETSSKHLPFSDDGTKKDGAESKKFSSARPTPNSQRGSSHIRSHVHLFSSDALDKAKRMNEEVDKKLKSIRDSHEEILRPKNSSRYSSR